MDHLYIRHAVGSKLFLDTDKHQLSFDIRHENEKWIICIEHVQAEMAEAILQNRDELNIFALAKAAPNEKSWFYTSAGLIEYHPDTQQLIITADKRFDYTT